mmetsp:Transcript_54441/g.128454  ORF Transcript_54441/g.128454 Transcript_54441/m.128454 type:complete len:213 (+) Transcript_54441:317-955(+)
MQLGPSTPSGLPTLHRTCEFGHESLCFLGREHCIPRESPLFDLHCSRSLQLAQSSPHHHRAILRGYNRSGNVRLFTTDLEQRAAGRSVLAQQSVRLLAHSHPSSIPRKRRPKQLCLGLLGSIYLWAGSLQPTHSHLLHRNHCARCLHVWMAVVVSSDSFPHLLLSLLPRPHSLLPHVVDQRLSDPVDRGRRQVPGCQVLSFLRTRPPVLLGR